MKDWLAVGFLAIMPISLSFLVLVISYWYAFYGVLHLVEQFNLDDSSSKGQNPFVTIFRSFRRLDEQSRHLLYRFLSLPIVYTIFLLPELYYKHITSDDVVMSDDSLTMRTACVLAATALVGRGVVNLVIWILTDRKAMDGWKKLLSTPPWQIRPSLFRETSFLGPDSIVDAMGMNMSVVDDGRATGVVASNPML